MNTKKKQTTESDSDANVTKLKNSNNEEKVHNAKREDKDENEKNHRVSGSQDSPVTRKKEQ